MILILYVAIHEERDIPILQSCELSGGLIATISRHIENMEALRYLNRAVDPDDRGRLLITMSSLSADAVDQWLGLLMAATRLAV